MLDINKYYLTDRGNELLLASIAEGAAAKPVAFCSLKFGSGALPGSEDAARALTGLVQPRQSFPLASVSCENGRAKISVAVKNDDIQTGYSLNEAGLYVYVEGKEELFAVARMGGDYIPAYSAGNAVSQIYTLIVAIGESTVALANEDVYVLKRDALTIEQVYPVGMVIPLLSENDPNDMWPTTKWRRLAGGAVLLSADDGEFLAGHEYGQNAREITRAELPREAIPVEVGEAGAHQHRLSNQLSEIGFDAENGSGSALRFSMGDARPWSDIAYPAITTEGGGHTHKGATEKLGAGVPLDVMQASVAVYFWQRIE